ncbi:hypothetical protein BKA83DRAFT_4060942, partial [Pisolithus microcarpus]
TTQDPLHGYCSIIYASDFFPLLDEENDCIVHTLRGLVSSEPSSLLCGSHLHSDDQEKDSYTGAILCHSPQIWTEMWDGTIFGMGETEVETSPRGRTVYL